MLQRPRRNRKSERIRSLVEENQLSVKDLILPLFVSESISRKEEVPSMPGIFRHTLDSLKSTAEEALNLGIPAIVLFPAIKEEHKDSKASFASHPDNLYLKALWELKTHFPELTLITDVAMDPYSSDGHDGYVENGQILNDLTLPILNEMAVAQAQAGADLIGPSDMMDGRVESIRTALDEAGFSDISLMSYTAKYASAFYGPFRDALHSAPKAGDKKTYQMNPANAREALREAQLDEQEGADILMVKPGMAYLDIIYRIRQQSTLPVAAYHVSGEYAMLKAAGQQHWIDYEQVMMESLLAFKRAGCDMILTYCALDAANVMQ